MQTTLSETLNQGIDTLQLKAFSLPSPKPGLVWVGQITDETDEPQSSLVFTTPDEMMRVSTLLATVALAWESAP